MQSTQLPVDITEKLKMKKQKKIATVFLSPNRSLCDDEQIVLVTVIGNNWS